MAKKELQWFEKPFTFDGAVAMGIEELETINACLLKLREQTKDLVKFRIISAVIYTTSGSGIGQNIIVKFRCYQDGTGPIEHSFDATDYDSW